MAYYPHIAVDIFASVGQRKYQIDGKPAKGSGTELVGRNDIISRYIFMKTQKYRTRKQVSSHIQVWAHCKKPPSSRNMDIPTFQELQNILRLYYSRPTTEFGQPKNKVRRVASTSNVPTAGSLGIYKSPSSLSSSQPLGRRKRGLQGAPEHLSKKCRRVVSELPPSSLSLLTEHNTEDSPLASLGTGCNSISLLWPQQTQHTRDTFNPLVLDNAFPGQQYMPAQSFGSLGGIYGTTMLVPSLDAYAIGDGPTGQDVGNTSIPVSATVFDTATITAIAGFEEALKSTAAATTSLMDDCTNLSHNAHVSPASFEFRNPTSLPELNNGSNSDGPTFQLSAFASATSCSVCPFEDSLAPTKAEQPDGPQIDDDVCNQALLVEAFGQYCAELSTNNSHFFPQYSWNQKKGEDILENAVFAPTPELSALQSIPPSKVDTNNSANSSSLAVMAPAQDTIPSSPITSSPNSHSGSSHRSTDGSTRAQTKTKSSSDVRSSPTCAPSMRSTGKDSNESTAASRMAMSNRSVLSCSIANIQNTKVATSDSSPVADWVSSLKNAIGTQNIDPNLIGTFAADQTQSHALAGTIAEVAPPSCLQLSGEAGEHGNGDWCSAITKYLHATSD